MFIGRILFVVRFDIKLFFRIFLTHRIRAQRHVSGSHHANNNGSTVCSSTSISSGAMNA